LAVFTVFFFVCLEEELIFVCNHALGLEQEWYDIANSWRFGQSCIKDGFGQGLLHHPQTFRKFSNYSVPIAVSCDLR
jgi:hypothetical protein